MNIQGISLLKLPAFKKMSNVYRYRGHSYGYSYNRDHNQIGFEARTINQLLANPKVIELAKKIETVNPEVKEDKVTMRSTSTGALEIQARQEVIIEA